MTDAKLIKLVRDAITTGWPDAGKLDPKAVFRCDERGIVVCLELGDSAADLFCEWGAHSQAPGQPSYQFIENTCRLGDIISKTLPAAYFEHETSGAMILVTSSCG